MADFLAHKIADEVYQWLNHNSNWERGGFEFTQAQLGNKIAETINLIRQQQPNELRPRADLPCFLWEKGEHRWDYTPANASKIDRCLCGAVRLPEDGFPG